MIWSSESFQNDGVIRRSLYNEDTQLSFLITSCDDVLEKHPAIVPIFPGFQKQVIVT
jgi:hypothetical protein